MTPLWYSSLTQFFDDEYESGVKPPHSKELTLTKAAGEDAHSFSTLKESLNDENKSGVKPPHSKELNSPK